MYVRKCRIALSCRNELLSDRLQRVVRNTHEAKKTTMMISMVTSKESHLLRERAVVHYVRSTFPWKNGLFLEHTSENALDLVVSTKLCKENLNL
ncbi:hypothetical protein Y032_0008g108 [Ancylostoma ceylanicum]|uniref:Uncharacterized protein n=1 Tax=Ancylostoma ceylanicum TaxID=53326 RepID=A0A016VKW3_9BILA|nr:hypothetical protein Y032_0008g108 [Ancylostoma ceylanicum]